MVDQTALVVPMEVKALVVNDKVRIGQNFQRWSMNYQNLGDFVSPEPPAFSGNANDFARNPQNNGVYVHWTLPEALRQGTHDPSSGSTTFVYVPNRWLVVRYSGRLEARVATAWVVESDFLDPNKGTVPYVDPLAPVGTLQVTSLGRHLNLNTPQWHETGSNKPFLTATGPGNITFSAYQPYVNDVFSIHDPLTDVSDRETLSYLVVGWYAQAEGDILSTWGQDNDFEQWLRHLNWGVEREKGDSSHVSLYQGMVYGITWDRLGNIPASAAVPVPEDVTLAVGNSSIDALTAMITFLVDNAGEETILDPQLLEAFQYDLLHLLDQPGGEELLEEKIHAAWFQGTPGGYRWEVVDKPIDNPALRAATGLLSASVLLQEEQWLADLNQAQAEYDQAAMALRASQWELYSVWWKQGNANNLPSSKYPTNLTPAQFQQQLNPQNPDGLLTSVARQMAEVQKLLQKIPHGKTQEELAQSIEQYAQEHALSETRELKCEVLPKFWQANNPVVLVAGAGTTGLLTEDKALPCRFPDQIVTGFTYLGTPITVSSLEGGIPMLDLTNLPFPGIISALWQEFFFLDPNNATLVAVRALHSSVPETISNVFSVMAAHKVDNEPLPAIDLNAWTQPWLPLFLMWEVHFYPIAHDTGGIENWSFNGSYSWTTEKGAASQAIILSGRIFLTPQCKFNFKSKLEKYLVNNPDANVQALEDFITNVNDWDLLSQALDGFNQQLIMRDPLGYLAPDHTKVLYQPDITLASLIGGEATYAPIPGLAKKPAGQDWPPSNFQQYRSGQFYFNRLMIVDRFGQSLEIVNSTTSQQFKPIRAEGLIPGKTVMPQEPYRFIQVPPRLLQPGRLNMEYVSSTDDSQIIGMYAGINPICAWVLPNHLNKALNFYDDEGAFIGEMRVITNDQQQKSIYWDGTVTGTYRTLAAVTVRFPHLGQFLTALSSRGAQTFYDLLGIIDQTLWTIDPLRTPTDQNISALVGRPLALVRTRLQFQLDSLPVADPSWRYTFNPLVPDFPGYKFPILLGNLNSSQDGLIGYFADSNYGQFNAVYPPQEGQRRSTNFPYIVPIGDGNYINLPFDGSSVAYLTMLVDPRASVHATTDILPVTELSLPAKYVAETLNAMDLYFRVGPFLSDSSVFVDQTPSGSDTQTTIIMPRLSAKNGTWSWLQNNGKSWDEYALSPSDQSVKFSNIPARFRTGFLKLVKSLQEKN